MFYHANSFIVNWTYKCFIPLILLYFATYVAIQLITYIYISFKQLSTVRVDKKLEKVRGKENKKRKTIKITTQIRTTLIWQWHSWRRVSSRAVPGSL